MKKRLILVPIILVCFLIGCAALGVKPWIDRTPKEKALAIVEAYNSQFKDTMTMALSINLTNDQKIIVRYKKTILKDIKPLIDIYIGIVENKGVPSKESEQKILNLLTKLGSKIGG